MTISHSRLVITSGEERKSASGLGGLLSSTGGSVFGSTNLHSRGSARATEAASINIAAASAVQRSSHLVCLIIVASLTGRPSSFPPEQGAQIGRTLNESRTVWVEPATGTGEFFTRGLTSPPGLRAG